MLDSLIPSSGTAELPRGVHSSDGWVRCLTLMLDEIDHGLLLLDGQGLVRQMNRAARLDLDASHPLRLASGRLHARTRAESDALEGALATARQQQTRQLLFVGDGEQRASVAMIPLGPDVLDDGPAVMVLLGRRCIAESLSVQVFARTRGLTPAETRVLDSLCAGIPPARIADDLGVRISTVRTHIGSLRHKTGAHSIGALVRMVDMLPPMLRTGREPHGLALDGVFPPQ